MRSNVGIEHFWSIIFLFACTLPRIELRTCSQSVAVLSQDYFRTLCNRKPPILEKGGKHPVPKKYYCGALALARKVGHNRAILRNDHIESKGISILVKDAPFSLKQCVPVAMLRSGVPDNAHAPRFRWSRNDDLWITQINGVTP
jgi:hypothetical protein